MGYDGLDQCLILKTLIFDEKSQIVMCLAS
jgi:hypothetical protein